MRMPDEDVDVDEGEAAAKVKVKSKRSSSKKTRKKSVQTDKVYGPPTGQQPPENVNNDCDNDGGDSKISAGLLPRGLTGISTTNDNNGIVTPRRPTLMDPDNVVATAGDVVPSMVGGRMTRDLLVPEDEEFVTTSVALRDNDGGGHDDSAPMAASDKSKFDHDDDGVSGMVRHRSLMNIDNINISPQDSGYSASSFVVGSPDVILLRKRRRVRVVPKKKKKNKKSKPKKVFNIWGQGEDHRHREGTNDHTTEISPVQREQGLVPSKGNEKDATEYPALHEAAGRVVGLAGEASATPTNMLFDKDFNAQADAVGSPTIEPGQCRGLGLHESAGRVLPICGVQPSAPVPDQVSQSMANKKPDNRPLHSAAGKIDMSALEAAAGSAYSGGSSKLEAESWILELEEDTRNGKASGHGLHGAAGAVARSENSTPAFFDELHPPPEGEPHAAGEDVVELKPKTGRIDRATEDDIWVGAEQYRSYNDSSGQTRFSGASDDMNTFYTRSTFTGPMRAVAHLYIHPTVDDPEVDSHAEEEATDGDLRENSPQQTGPRGSIEKTLARHVANYSAGDATPHPSSLEKFRGAWGSPRQGKAIEGCEGTNAASYPNRDSFPEPRQESVAHPSSVILSNKQKKAMLSPILSPSSYYTLDDSEQTGPRTPLHSMHTLDESEDSHGPGNNRVVSAALSDSDGDELPQMKKVSEESGDEASFGPVAAPATVTPKPLTVSARTPTNDSDSVDEEVEAAAGEGSEADDIAATVEVGVQTPTSVMVAADSYFVKHEQKSDDSPRNRASQRSPGSGATSELVSREQNHTTASASDGGIHCGPVEKGTAPSRTALKYLLRRRQKNAHDSRRNTGVVEPSLDVTGSNGFEVVFAEEQGVVETRKKPFFRRRQRGSTKARRARVRATSNNPNFSGSTCMDGAHGATSSLERKNMEKPSGSSETPSIANPPLKKVSVGGQVGAKAPSSFRWIKSNLHTSRTKGDLVACDLDKATNMSKSCSPQRTVAIDAEMNSIEAVAGQIHLPSSVERISSGNNPGRGDKAMENPCQLELRTEKPGRVPQATTVTERGDRHEPEMGCPPQPQSDKPPVTPVEVPPAAHCDVPPAPSCDVQPKATPTIAYASRKVSHRVGLTKLQEAASGDPRADATSPLYEATAAKTVLPDAEASKVKEPSQDMKGKCDADGADARDDTSLYSSEMGIETSISQVVRGGHDGKGKEAQQDANPVTSCGVPPHGSPEALAMSVGTLSPPFVSTDVAGPDRQSNRVVGAATSLTNCEQRESKKLGRTSKDSKPADEKKDGEASGRKFRGILIDDSQQRFSKQQVPNLGERNLNELEETSKEETSKEETLNEGTIYERRGGREVTKKSVSVAEREAPLSETTSDSFKPKSHIVEGCTMLSTQQCERNASGAGRLAAQTQGNFLSSSKPQSQSQTENDASRAAINMESSEGEGFAVVKDNKGCNTVGKDDKLNGVESVCKTEFEVLLRDDCPGTASDAVEAFVFEDREQSNSGFLPRRVALPRDDCSRTAQSSDAVEAFVFDDREQSNSGRRVALRSENVPKGINLKSELTEKPTCGSEKPEQPKSRGKSRSTAPSTRRIQSKTERFKESRLPRAEHDAGKRLKRADVVNMPVLPGKIDHKAESRYEKPEQSKARAKSQPRSRSKAPPALESKGLIFHLNQGYLKTTAEEKNLELLLKTTGKAESGYKKPEKSKTRSKTPSSRRQKSPVAPRGESKRLQFHHDEPPRISKKTAERKSSSDKATPSKAAPRHKSKERPAQQDEPVRKAAPREESLLAQQDLPLQVKKTKSEKKSTLPENDEGKVASGSEATEQARGKAKSRSTTPSPAQQKEPLQLGKARAEKNPKLEKAPDDKGASGSEKPKQTEPKLRSRTPPTRLHRKTAPHEDSKGLVAQQEQPSHVKETNTGKKSMVLNKADENVAPVSEKPEQPKRRAESRSKTPSARRSQSKAVPRVRLPEQQDESAPLIMPDKAESKAVSSQPAGESCRALVDSAGNSDSLVAECVGRSSASNNGTRLAVRLRDDTPSMALSSDAVEAFVFTQGEEKLKTRTESGKRKSTGKTEPTLFSLKAPDQQACLDDTKRTLKDEPASGPEKSKQTKERSKSRSRTPSERRINRKASPQVLSPKRKEPPDVEKWPLLSGQSEKAASKQLVEEKLKGVDKRVALTASHAQVVAGGGQRDSVSDPVTCLTVRLRDDAPTMALSSDAVEAFVFAEVEQSVSPSASGTRISSGSTKLDSGSLGAPDQQTANRADTKSKDGKVGPGSGPAAYDLAKHLASPIKKGAFLPQDVNQSSSSYTTKQDLPPAALAVRELEGNQTDFASEAGTRLAVRLRDDSPGIALSSDAVEAFVFADEEQSKSRSVSWTRTTAETTETDLSSKEINQTDLSTTEINQHHLCISADPKPVYERAQGSEKPKQPQKRAKSRSATPSKRPIKVKRVPCEELESKRQPQQEKAELRTTGKTKARTLSTAKATSTQPSANEEKSRSRSVSRKSNTVATAAPKLASSKALNQQGAHPDTKPESKDGAAPAKKRSKSRSATPSKRGAGSRTSRGTAQTLPQKKHEQPQTVKIVKTEKKASSSGKDDPKASVEVLKGADKSLTGASCIQPKKGDPEWSSQFAVRLRDDSPAMALSSDAVEALAFFSEGHLMSQSGARTIAPDHVQVHARKMAPGSEKTERVKKVPEAHPTSPRKESPRKEKHSARLDDKLELRSKKTNAIMALTEGPAMQETGSFLRNGVSGVKTQPPAGLDEASRVQVIFSNDIQTLVSSHNSKSELKTTKPASQQETQNDSKQTSSDGPTPAKPSPDTPEPSYSGRSQCRSSIITSSKQIDETVLMERAQSVTETALQSGTFKAERQRMFPEKASCEQKMTTRTSKTSSPQSEYSRAGQDLDRNVAISCGLGLAALMQHDNSQGLHRTPDPVKSVGRQSRSVSRTGASAERSAVTTSSKAIDNQEKKRASGRLELSNGSTKPLPEMPRKARTGGNRDASRALSTTPSKRRSTKKSVPGVDATSPRMPEEFDVKRPSDQATAKVKEARESTTTSACRATLSKRQGGLKTSDDQEKLNLKFVSRTTTTAAKTEPKRSAKADDQEEKRMLPEQGLQQPSKDGSRSSSKTPLKQRNDTKAAVSVHQRLPLQQQMKKTDRKERNAILPDKVDDNKAVSNAPTGKPKKANNSPSRPAMVAKKDGQHSAAPALRTQKGARLHDHRGMPEQAHTRRSSATPSKRRNSSEPKQAQQLRPLQPQPQPPPSAREKTSSHQTARKPEKSDKRALDVGDGQASGKVTKVDRSVLLLTDLATEAPQGGRCIGVLAQGSQRVARLHGDSGAVTTQDSSKSRSVSRRSTTTTSTEHMSSLQATGKERIRTVSKPKSKEGDIRTGVLQNPNKARSASRKRRSASQTRPATERTGQKLSSVKTGNERQMGLVSKPQLNEEASAVPPNRLAVMAEEAVEHRNHGRSRTPAKHRISSKAKAQGVPQPHSHPKETDQKERHTVRKVDDKAHSSRPAGELKQPPQSLAATGTQLAVRLYDGFPSIALSSDAVEAFVCEEDESKSRAASPTTEPAMSSSNALDTLDTGLTSHSQLQDKASAPSEMVGEARGQSRGKSPSSTPSEGGIKSKEVRREHPSSESQGGSNAPLRSRFAITTRQQRARNDSEQEDQREVNESTLAEATAVSANLPPGDDAKPRRESIQTDKRSFRDKLRSITPSKRRRKMERATVSDRQQQQQAKLKKGESVEKQKSLPRTLDVEKSTKLRPSTSRAAKPVAHDQPRSRTPSKRRKTTEPSLSPSEGTTKQDLLLDRGNVGGESNGTPLAVRLQSTSPGMALSSNDVEAVVLPNEASATRQSETGPAEPISQASTETEQQQSTTSVKSKRHYFSALMRKASPASKASREDPEQSPKATKENDKRSRRRSTTPSKRQSRRTQKCSSDKQPEQCVDGNETVSDDPNKQQSKLGKNGSSGEGAIQAKDADQFYRAPGSVTRLVERDDERPGVALPSHDVEAVLDSSKSRAKSRPVSQSSTATSEPTSHSSRRAERQSTNTDVTVAGEKKADGKSRATTPSRQRSRIKVASSSHQQVDLQQQQQQRSSREPRDSAIPSQGGSDFSPPSLEESTYSGASERNSSSFLNYVHSLLSVNGVFVGTNGHNSISRLNEITLSQRNLDMTNLITEYSNFNSSVAQGIETLREAAGYSTLSNPVRQLITSDAPAALALEQRRRSSLTVSNRDHTEENMVNEPEVNRASPPDQKSANATGADGAVGVKPTVESSKTTNDSSTTRTPSTNSDVEPSSTPPERETLPPEKRSEREQKDRPSETQKVSEGGTRGEVFKPVSTIKSLNGQELRVTQEANVKSTEVCDVSNRLGRGGSSIISETNILRNQEKDADIKEKCPQAVAQDDGGLVVSFTEEKQSIAAVTPSDCEQIEQSTMTNDGTTYTKISEPGTVGRSHQTGFTGTSEMSSTQYCPEASLSTAPNNSMPSPTRPKLPMATRVSDMATPRSAIMSTRRTGEEWMSILSPKTGGTVKPFAVSTTPTSGKSLSEESASHQPKQSQISSTPTETTTACVGETSRTEESRQHTRAVDVVDVPPKEDDFPCPKTPIPKPPLSPRRPLLLSTHELNPTAATPPKIPVVKRNSLSRSIQTRSKDSFTEVFNNVAATPSIFSEAGIQTQSQRSQDVSSLVQRSAVASASQDSRFPREEGANSGTRTMQVSQVELGSRERSHVPIVSALTLPATLTGQEQTSKFAAATSTAKRGATFDCDTAAVVGAASINNHSPSTKDVVLLPTTKSEVHDGHACRNVDESSVLVKDRSMISEREQGGTLAQRVASLTTVDDRGILEMVRSALALTRDEDAQEVGEGEKEEQALEPRPSNAQNSAAPVMNKSTNKLTVTRDRSALAADSYDIAKLQSHAGEHEEHVRPDTPSAMMLFVRDDDDDDENEDEQLSKSISTNGKTPAIGDRVITSYSKDAKSVVVDDSRQPSVDWNNEGTDTGCTGRDQPSITASSADGGAPQQATTETTNTTHDAAPDDNDDDYQCREMNNNNATAAPNDESKNVMEKQVVSMQSDVGADRDYHESNKNNMIMANDDDVQRSGNGDAVASSSEVSAVEQNVHGSSEGTSGEETKTSTSESGGTSASDSGRTSSESGVDNNNESPSVTTCTRSSSCWDDSHHGLGGGTSSLQRTSEATTTESNSNPTTSKDGKKKRKKKRRSGVPDDVLKSKTFAI